MVRRIAGMLAVMLGLAVCVYATWAAERIGDQALRERAWPRAFPYPDCWLLGLNNYYDKKYPAPPGHFKIHGELDRVRRDVTWTNTAGTTLLVGGLMMLMTPAIFRLTRPKGRGFDVLVSVSTPSADPVTSGTISPPSPLPR